MCVCVCPYVFLCVQSRGARAVFQFYPENSTQVFKSLFFTCFTCQQYTKCILRMDLLRQGYTVPHLEFVDQKRHLTRSQSTGTGQLVQVVALYIRSQSTDTGQLVQVVALYTRSSSSSSSPYVAWRCLLPS